MREAHRSPSMICGQRDTMRPAVEQDAVRAWSAGLTTLPGSDVNVSDQSLPVDTDRIHDAE